jgi:predicted transcriptional regulator
MPKTPLHFKLKCKGNKKKRHSAIGDVHKKKILDIISSSYGSGITLTEITEKTKRTRQAVHPFLKELVKEAKIFRAKNRFI